MSSAQRVLQLRNLCVVLVAPRNPLNIGAVARAMCNFGAGTLRVVNPYQVAFGNARSAVGAEDLLARAEVFPSVADAVADCALVVGTTAPARREPRHVVRSLGDAASRIGTALGQGRVALLFGSEKRGLANEDLAHCNWLLYIPTEQQQPSMNLGQAVAVCLYELARVRATGATESATSRVGLAEHFAEGSIAGAAELERLTTVLLEALETSGYTLPDRAAGTEGSVRRLVRRLALNKDDAETVLGMLRQMLWRMRSGR